jgi:hypothetical protein
MSALRLITAETYFPIVLEARSSNKVLEGDILSLKLNRVFPWLFLASSGGWLAIASFQPLLPMSSPSVSLFSHAFFL